MEEKVHKLNYMDPHARVVQEVPLYVKERLLKNMRAERKTEITTPVWSQKWKYYLRIILIDNLPSFKDTQDRWILKNRMSN